MLTVDFDRLGLRPGERVLDLGCGAGRHAIEAARRGARVVAVDLAAAELRTAAERSGETERLLRAPLAGGAPRGLCADATRLPLPGSSIDVVVASEVLEHLPDDGAAVAEIVRVLRPGGRVALTVPRHLPERVCWWLSGEYHEVEGGHLRIYRGDELRALMRAAGLRVEGSAHAHALHTPYWWLRCALGVGDDTRRAVRLYHRLLVWDLMRRPRLTRTAERLLDPLLGKSLVVYARRPAEGGRAGARTARAGGTADGAAAA